MFKKTIIALGFILAFGFCLETQAGGYITAVISADEFEREVRASKTPVLVAFTATWCGVCKRMQDKFEKLASEAPNDMKVVQIDIDVSPDLADEYSVEGVPSLFVIKDGRTVQHVEGGYKTYESFKNWATR